MSEPDITSQDQVVKKNNVPVDEIPVVVEAPASAPQSEPDVVASPAPIIESPTPASPPPINSAPQLGYASLLKKALEKIQFRKRAKLEKIVKFVLQKKSIANDDVEKLLRISDKTATRYLNQLSKEGRLIRVGAPQHARYEPAGLPRQ